jgi:hypothetical protein
MQQNRDNRQPEVFNNWRLVGECYVSSVMLGELVDGPNVEKVYFNSRVIVLSYNYVSTNR